MKVSKKSIVFEKSDTRFKKVQFVLKAQEKKTEPTKVLYGVVIEDEGDRQLMVASDGCRLHACLLGKAGVFPCGRYSYDKGKTAVTFSLDEHAKPYPVWRNIVPKKTVRLSDLWVDKEEPHTALWQLYSVGVAVRVEHIADLAGFGDWKILQSARDRQATLVCRAPIHEIAALIQPPVVRQYTYPQPETVKETGGLFA